MGDTIWDALSLPACVAFVEHVELSNVLSLDLNLLELCVQFLESRAPICSKSLSLYTLLAHDIANTLNRNNLLHPGCTAFPDGIFVRFRAPVNESSRDAWHIERSARLLRRIAPDRSLNDLRAKMQEFVENTVRRSN